MKTRKNSLVLVLLLFCTSPRAADGWRANLSLEGQMTAWTLAGFEQTRILQSGGRFVPTLKGNLSFKPQSAFQLEASLHMYGNLDFSNGSYQGAYGKFKAYRLWAGYHEERFEIRAGLQKINFGQAKMFRPLMWFDAMDIRDPLQLTDGVFGLLGKYYFENNSNVWLWCLLGNNQNKGWEITGSETWIPEMGGRFEMPAGKGEIALSTHFRSLRKESSLSGTDYPGEFRWGLDGKWDFGIGLWFEASSCISSNKALLIPRFQDMLNLGIDYTFGLGNGLGLTLEYLYYHSGSKFLLADNRLHLLGSMLNYSPTILDNLSALVFYMPAADKLFNYLSWGRVYDDWSFYLIAYLNPTDIQMPGPGRNSDNSVLYSGKGFQVMASYYF